MKHHGPDDPKFLAALPRPTSLGTWRPIGELARDIVELARSRSERLESVSCRMNAQNMNVDSALALAPSDMIADTLRNSVLRDVANMTETGDAALNTLRSKAADMATLAGHWHDPHGSFTALHGAATRSGLIPAAQSRGILIAAFGADYSQLDMGPDDVQPARPTTQLAQFRMMSAKAFQRKSDALSRSRRTRRPSSPNWNVLRLRRASVLTTGVWTTVSRLMRWSRRRTRMGFVQSMAATRLSMFARLASKAGLREQTARSRCRSRLRPASGRPCRASTGRSPRC